LSRVEATATCVNRTLFIKAKSAVNAMISILFTCY
jgi:hypothetical protein